MRSIAAGQEHFQKGNIVDQDSDGMGEFGWLGELSGAEPCRVAGLPMTTSPFIAPILGMKDKYGNAPKSGFYFRMYLQGPDGTWVGEPMLEKADAPTGGGGAEAPRKSFAESKQAADLNETRWICYAWPQTHTHTGDQAFVVNEAGEVWATQYEEGVGDGGPYTGAIHRPLPLAAFTADGMRIADGARRERAQDGRLWRRVGE
ncbi:MAG: hypothetical protein ACYTGX_08805 [Planctomycetota bacterium]|jgi:hypothetical protein